ncbi:MAG: tryptophan synthase subunit alpha [Chromatiales bacterium]|nr:tryptophan synthase subunit alpha [Chromatiales bacterium]
MNRIERRFQRLREAGRKALIPYLTAGDPHPDQTVRLMRELVAAGADLIELGVPFSDPMADGPVIQRASERALAHGTRLVDVLGMVAEFRRSDSETPVVLMGYLNPIEAMGARVFSERAVASGVDGVLIVDLPPEEGDDLLPALTEAGLNPIFLISPTTTAARMDRIAAVARGFVYYVSLKGVTGAANLDTAAVTRRIAEIRRHTSLPVGVGFGIRDAESAASVAEIADAVIVGSALVSLVGEYAGRLDELAARLTALLGSMRAAIDHRAAA